MFSDLTANLTPYCGPPPAASALWGAWNFDPPLIIALALMALCGLLSPRRWVFALGWLGLVIAFVSPLCALTVALFAARGLHHLLIMCLSAPLLALSFPQIRNPVPPLAALIPLLAALVIWHLPPVYSAAWGDGRIYWLMQAILILPAVIFWHGIFAAARAGHVIAPLALILGLGAVMGLIGAVLTFAPQALYGEHALGSALYGLDPLTDQQLAGLLMWVPGLLPLALIGAGLLRGVWRRQARLHKIGGAA